MSRRVLLIEDEDSIREIARIGLERVGGWEVTSVASGQAALEAAERVVSPEVVLIDVMMPGLDGPATMLRLKAGPLREREVPFVFLTAKRRTADRERLMGLGAAGVIAKPFDPMTLAEQLDRILAGAQHVHAAFAEQWLRARPTIEGRLDVIDAALASLAGGRERPRPDLAIADAHMLAGTLGTFGLGRGSELARRIEAGLESGAEVGMLNELTAELRELVERAQVTVPSAAMPSA